VVNIGSGLEASPGWVQGDKYLQAFIHASYKIDGDANEDGGDKICSAIHN
jgi:hypothetical protein